MHRSNSGDAVETEKKGGEGSAAEVKEGSKMEPTETPVRGLSSLMEWRIIVTGSPRPEISLAARKGFHPLYFASHPVCFGHSIYTFLYKFAQLRRMCRRLSGKMSHERGLNKNFQREKGRE